MSEKYTLHCTCIHVHVHVCNLTTKVKIQHSLSYMMPLIYACVNPLHIPNSLRQCHLSNSTFYFWKMVFLISLLKEQCEHFNDIVCVADAHVHVHVVHHRHITKQTGMCRGHSMEAKQNKTSAECSDGETKFASNFKTIPPSYVESTKEGLDVPS